MLDFANLNWIEPAKFICRTTLEARSRVIIGDRVLVNNSSLNIKNGIYQFFILKKLKLKIILLFLLKMIILFGILKMKIGII